MSRYTFTCDAGPYSGGDLALSGGLALTVPRPETCWAHFTSLCFSLTHLSTGDWGGKKEMDGERRERKDSCLPSTFILPRLLWICLPSALHVLPSLPRFSHHPVYLQGLLPCVCFSYLSLSFSLSLSPSLSFSPILRGGQKVEERRDGEKVRWLGWAREENEQQNRGIKEIDGLFFCRGCP